MDGGKNSGRRARVAVLLGDPAGIGPEIAVKLLARTQNTAAVDVLLIADPNVLAAGERVAAAKLDCLRIESTDAELQRALRFEPGRITWWVQPTIAAGDLRQGEATEAGGRAALRALDAAVEAARQGLVDAIVFAPLNKHALRLAGMTHEDELRFMQERFAVPGFVCEFNITQGLWTSRVTSHVPLRDVADAITAAGVGEAVDIIDRALKSAGVARPRIAVAGLNPHAGDGGSIGMEEIEIIAPAVEQCRARGVEAQGPYPSDTVFVRAKRGDFDAVVSMYHDQGQIAMKLMGFDNGVTLHGGLPVPVATCASGTAFDIAGKGVANVEGLQQAFSLASRMATLARAA